ncbi:hypothetical protein PMIN06_002661 [Paraphaeosphaeria minitans]
MRFSSVALILASTATILAAPAPVPDQGEALSDSVLVRVYAEKDFKGELLKIGTTKAVDEHPENGGSNAVCFSVKPNFASSVYLASFQYPGRNGFRPSACKLYAEDGCQGDSVEVHKSTMMDIEKLADLGNYGFDKRAASLKCYLNASW